MAEIAIIISVIDLFSNLFSKEALEVLNKKKNLRVIKIIGLKKFKGLTRWYEEISKREAVQRGYDLLNKGDHIPKV